jgi:hypothetical protein
MGLHGSAISRTASSNLATRGAMALAVLAAAGVSGSMPAIVAKAPVAHPVASVRALPVAVAAAAAAAPAIATPPAAVIAFAEKPQAVLKFTPTSDDRYYEQLRSRIHWEPIRLGDRMLKTPDPVSRVLLTQAAAQKVGLARVGLNWRDVYGIINAETSWIPRLGASKDGTPNLGIAQFEPATARALGLRNPEDPVEAVHAAALHLKEAAEWSAKRIAGLKLTESQYASKLREGLSIYYNLSTKGRAVWNGTNTAKLPIETRRHIANARRGRRAADELADELAAVRARTGLPGVMTASFGSPNS